MQLRYCCITATAATAVDAKFAFVPQSAALNIGPLTSGPAAAAPAVAAALALAATATIFGAQYAVAYTPAVVPAVAVTPVAYATKLPQLLYAVKISLIMILSLPPNMINMLQFPRAASFPTSHNIRKNSTFHLTFIDYID